MDSKGIKRFKWGIVGPGHIARDFIKDMRLIKECVNEVTGVMSNKLEEARHFAQIFQIPYYFDQIEEMTRIAKPDIVYIATPHPLHFGYTMELLRAHIAILCEKPMAINADQCSQMINCAQDYHTFLMEGMWIRFLPSLHRVLDLLRQGAIGKINSIVASMSYLAPKDLENRFYNPSLGGGSLLDLGIYPVYLSQLILGDPIFIKSTAILSSGQIDKSCAMLLGYPNDCYALLESSIIKEMKNNAVILGEKGIITIMKPWNEKTAGIQVSLNQGKTTTYPCRWEGRGFQFEIRAVLKNLSSGQIENEFHNHSKTLSLINLLDEIRKQAHISYPMD